MGTRKHRSLGKITGVATPFIQTEHAVRSHHHGAEQLTDEQVGEAVEILKLVADPTRRRIRWTLLHAEHSVYLARYGHVQRIVEKALFHADHVVQGLADHDEPRTVQPTPGRKPA